MIKKRKKTKKKLKLKVKNCLLVLMIFVLLLIVVNKLFLKKNNFINTIEEKINYICSDNDKKKIEEQLNEYNKCILEKYNASDETQDILNKKKEIDYYIYNNYLASVYYEDINTGFVYKYKESESYYGASLIKIVEAMYLYDKAQAGEIDLNDKIEYTKKYVADFSTGMEKKKIGDMVPINELISYTMTYSDNSAHFMLIDYIGVSKLREYGKSLGAKNISTLTSSDTFGNQSANDTNIYLHHAYEIINSSSEYGKLLKKYMLNTDHNALYLSDNNNVAHKYGSYGSYFHDIGIVYEDKPYYISILTNHGKGDYNKIVKNIHQKVNELHHLFYEQRQNNCHIQIYGS